MSDVKELTNQLVAKRLQEAGITLKAERIPQKFSIRFKIKGYEIGYFDLVACILGVKKAQPNSTEHPNSLLIQAIKALPHENNS